MSSYIVVIDFGGQYAHLIQQQLKSMVGSTMIVETIQGIIVFIKQLLTLLTMLVKVPIY